MTEILDKYCDGLIDFDCCFFELKSKILDCVVNIDVESDSTDWVDCLDDARECITDLYYLVGSRKMNMGVEYFKFLSGLAELVDL